ncbi:hypothetical protein D3C76_1395360 [compost metagenome]
MYDNINFFQRGLPISLAVDRRHTYRVYQSADRFWPLTVLCDYVKTPRLNKPVQQRAPHKTGGSRHQNALTG